MGKVWVHMGVRPDLKHQALPYLLCLATVSAVLGAVWLLDRSEHGRFLQRTRSAVLQHVSATRAKLEQSLNARLFLVRGLEAFVRAHGPTIDETDFQHFARKLKGQQEGIRSLPLAPDSVVTHVFPIEGNEAAVGHDLMADPARREAVQRAIDNKEFIIAGPVQLRQGGVALIGRMPIFLPGPGATAKASRYWGLAIILIDLDPLFGTRTCSMPQRSLGMRCAGRTAWAPPARCFLARPRFSDPNRP